MNGTIYVAIGVIFLALASIYYGQSKKARSDSPQPDKPRNSHVPGLLFTIAGVAFFVAAAIVFITAD